MLRRDVIYFELELKKLFLGLEDCMKSSIQLFKLSFKLSLKLFGKVFSFFVMPPKLFKYIGPFRKTEVSQSINKHGQDLYQHPPNRFF